MRGNQEKKIMVDPDILQEIMDEKKFSRYRLLDIIGKSEPTLYRYMRVGWPQSLFNFLCKKLNVKPEILRGEK